VARAAAAAAPDLPVVAVAGVCSLSPDQLSSAGIARAYTLADIEPDLTRCLEQPGPLLEELAGHIARDWLAPLPTCRPYVSPSTTYPRQPRRCHLVVVGRPGSPVLPR
jgi:hypothetical protein